MHVLSCCLRSKGLAVVMLRCEALPRMTVPGSPAAGTQQGALWELYRRLVADGWQVDVRSYTTAIRSCLTGEQLSVQCSVWLRASSYITACGFVQAAAICSFLTRTQLVMQCSMRLEAMRGMASCAACKQGSMLRHRYKHVRLQLLVCAGTGLPR